MGVAAYRRGSAAIVRDIREQWKPIHDATEQRLNCEQAAEYERRCRADLDALWRYEERVLPVLAKGQRLTVRERARWDDLRAEFRRLRRTGGHPLAQRGVARRISEWARRVHMRWAHLCARGLREDPRLVEVSGVSVWPSFAPTPPGATP